ncbi:MAG: hypothetical protein RMM17_05110 [Acidobacteriota bacterium]|nr:tetratricopeptide repeat protein [Blastocatellia bacterium]MDW8412044.1 hypothetical protein [Acidobacteriota bacterium]
MPLWLLFLVFCQSQIIRLEEYNVTVKPDERLVVMSLALDAAGYDGARSKASDYLGSRALQADVALVSQMRVYYSLQARKGNKLSSYMGLALSAGLPPDFALSDSTELPDDVAEVRSFLPLLRDFYARCRLAALLEHRSVPVQHHREVVTRLLYETINYLHTKPQLYLPSGSSEEARSRSLKFYINPLLPEGVVFQRNDMIDGASSSSSRRVGDEYFCVMSETISEDAVRYALLRFILDPIVAKKAVEVAMLRDKIAALVERVPTAHEDMRRNVYEVVGESLARAAEVRMTLRQDQDEAMYRLGTYYEQGAVLVFHFYEALAQLERVGIDVGEYLAPSLRQIDFERESRRLEQTAAARRRAELRRAELRNSAKLLLEIDSLISERQYDQARRLLEGLLESDPKNARALFALARIYNNQLTSVELDESADEEDKIAAQQQRLARAVELYRRSIANATEQEKWMVSQSHVYIGQILDFMGLSEAASVEYESAIKLGNIPRGAYPEAVNGKAGAYRLKGGKADDDAE